MCWFRRRKRERQDPRTLVQEDCTRVLGFLESVLVDARRVGVPVEEGVDACVTVLRAWAERIRRSSLDR